MARACIECNTLKESHDFYPRGSGKPRDICRLCCSSHQSKKEPWTHVEDDEIRDNYPVGGWAACNLPQRGRMAIQQRAYKLGVHVAGHEGKRKKGEGEKFGLPADDRPEEVRRLDYVLMRFRECEPAANLVPSLGVFSEVA